MVNLTERLAELNGKKQLESMKNKNQAKLEYMRAIQETEASYMKVLESSQNSLKTLKKSK